MKSKSIPVLNLVRDLNMTLDDEIGEEVANKLIGAMVHSRNVDYDAFFAPLVEAEWVRRQLLMQLMPRLDNLALQINNIKRDFTINSYSVNNLGATLYGHS